MKPKVKLTPVRNKPSLVTVTPAENLLSYVLWSILAIIVMIWAVVMIKGSLFWLAVGLMFVKDIAEKNLLTKFRFIGDVFFVAIAVVLFIGGGLIPLALWSLAYPIQWFGRWVGFGHVFASNTQVKDRLRHISPEQILPSDPPKTV